MATSNSQRVGIIIIAVIMVIGTIGSFAVLILANQNASQDTVRQQEAYDDYMAKVNERNDAIQAQADDLSEKYYATFQPYTDKVAKYNLDSVGDMIKTTDLKQGDGETIDGETPFAAYYIGWNPDGKIFDQSIDEDAKKLKQPLYYSDEMSGSVGLEEGLDNASLIQGWKDGMKGMKIGGVRLIEIPSDLAYGEAGGGDDIPPNTPIKFVVMAIDKLKDIEQPEIPEILMRGL